jgi:hypothetical protein
MKIGCYTAILVLTDKEILFLFSLYVKQNQHTWYHLAMFFRDELLSWSWRRPAMPSVPVQVLNAVDFERKVTTNVEHAIARIKSIAPQFLSDEVNSELF